ncbi:MAG: hypothetical protein AAF597_11800 [Bacteroidota bacterium]
MLLTYLPNWSVAANPAGEYFYDFSPEAQAIYADIMALELDRAQANIDLYRERVPTNLVGYHLESYLDFFRLYLSGDERLDDNLEARFERRIDALEQGDESSPWYNYALAEARLHRSLIHIRFERQLAAFRELNKANKLLRSNAKYFPDFLLTYKDLGLLHAAVGSIPAQYKWGVELFSSLNGTIAEGREELALARAMPNNPFQLETEVLSAYLELHLAGKAEAAWQQIAGLSLSPETNPLHCFLVANMAMRSGRNDLALRTLEAQPRLRSAADVPDLEFRLGLAKIRTLDPLARLHFKSFNLRYTGRHFKEEARQKIAWCLLLDEDVVGYREAMTAIAGGSRAGGDENAVREAAFGRPPHPGLLRARLLFDGNYCTRARAQLEAVNTQSLTPEEYLEYLYRTGRVLDGLEQYDSALSFYLATVNTGRDDPAFYACKAALQAGLIEEKRNQKLAAKQHFQTCLNISPEEYKTALHLLAKAGLNRVR